MISFNCNNVSAPATITITQGGGFNVTSNSSYTIDGGNVITLTGNNIYRILNVQAGGVLRVTNILLMHGYAAFGGLLPTQGGALLDNGGLLVLDHTTVRDSQSNLDGGGIYHSGSNASQSISLENSILAYSPSGGNCYRNPAGCPTLKKARVTLKGRAAIAVRPFCRYGNERVGKDWGLVQQEEASELLRLTCNKLKNVL
jgi:hypothetical protein